MKRKCHIKQSTNRKKGQSPSSVFKTNSIPQGLYITSQPLEKLEGTGICMVIGLRYSEEFCWHLLGASITLHLFGRLTCSDSGSLPNTILTFISLLCHPIECLFSTLPVPLLRQITNSLTITVFATTEYIINKCISWLGVAVLRHPALTPKGTSCPANLQPVPPPGFNIGVRRCGAASRDLNKVHRQGRERYTSLDIIFQKTSSEW
jgi:hypothetical protein